MTKEKRTKIIAAVLIIAVVIAAIIEINADLKKSKAAETAEPASTAVSEELTEIPADTEPAADAAEDTAEVPDVYTPDQVRLTWNEAAQDWDVEANGQKLSNYTGIASNDWGQFYVSNGKYDPTYSGSFVQNGTAYAIEAGQVKA